MRRNRFDSLGVAGDDRLGGPVDGAISARPLNDVNSAATWSAPAITAAIAPPDGSACISRPRAATSNSASSRLIAPATHAATYSPRLCPITASGVMPQDAHNSARAYSMANSAGCANRASSSSEAPFAENTAGNRSVGSVPRRPAAHRSMAARNTGSVS